MVQIKNETFNGNKNFEKADTDPEKTKIEQSRFKQLIFFEKRKYYQNIDEKSLYKVNIKI